VVTALDVTESHTDRIVVDVTCMATDEAHAELLTQALREVQGVTVRKVSDRTFLLHLGGKIEVRSKVPLRTRDDLSMAYTPGRRPDLPGHRPAPGGRPAADGQAQQRRRGHRRVGVLGLGDLGPSAALPVMEGKAALFKRFADIDAWPICLDTQDVDEIVRTVQLIAPGVRRHQPRGHRRARAASRSSGGCASCWTSRCSTTTSTARRSSCSPP
jgi:malate dehydrogenase (oxaloacetate-decarboxylating)